MLVYPSAIDLSTRTLRYPTGQLAARRRQIDTRWRRLTAGRQALLALAHLRCGDTSAQLAAGFGIGIGIATVYRYMREAVAVLSLLAPSLAEAMRTIREKAFVVRHPRRHTAAYRPHRRRHPVLLREAQTPPLNVQALTDPFGRLLRASSALPGSTHDLTAARQHGIIEALAKAGLKCWADKAFQGAGGPVRVPFRGRRLKKWKRRHNTTHAKIRCVGEQAMATLKGRRLLRKLPCSTNRIPDVVKAVLVLRFASA
ncbi:transposase family protein [Streptomyces sp. NBC_00081]